MEGGSMCAHLFYLIYPLYLRLRYIYPSRSIVVNASGMYLFEYAVYSRSVTRSMDGRSPPQRSMVNDTLPGQFRRAAAEQLGRDLLLLQQNRSNSNR